MIAAGRNDPAGSPAPPDPADPAVAARPVQVSAIDGVGDDPARAVWVGPAAHRLRRPAPVPGAPGRPSHHGDVAAVAACADCPLRTRCLRPGAERRQLNAQRSRLTGAMRFKLRQPAARRRDARRKAIVEPVFGQLKDARGFTSCSRRGLALATGEYRLAGLAHNRGKLLRICPLPVARVAPMAGLIPVRTTCRPQTARSAPAPDSPPGSSLRLTPRSTTSTTARLPPAVRALPPLRADP